MTRVVGIVADMPCCSVGGMAHVTSRVQPPCAGSLASRPRLGRGADCARVWSLVKAEIAPETQGSGETEPALEAGGSGETDPAPEAGGVGRPSYSFLPFFISLILVSYGLLYPTMV